MSVGMPAHLYLDLFGYFIYRSFGEIPYQVGSSLTGKKWRDVDIRLILDDKEYSRQGYGSPNSNNIKRMVYEMAYSELGKRITGLPIDFQIQQQTKANKMFKGNRSALGMWFRLALSSQPHR